MIWLTFLGAGLVLRYGGHIGIDTLQERVPRLAPTIRAAIFVVMLAFFAVMLWLGVRYAALTWGQTTPVMQIPIGAVYLAMPIGFALLIVHALLMAAPYVRERRFLADAEFDADAVKIVIATLFVACIVLLALGVPVAFALGGCDARRDPRQRHAAARRAAEIRVQRHRRLRADGGAVLHPHRRADDRRRAVRSAAALRVAVRRPLPRRPRSHEHPCDHVLLGDQRLRARRCRGPRRDHDPDDEERRLPRRVRRGAHRRGVDPRTDHPAVDQHDHLRARLSGDQPRRTADRRRASGNRDRDRDGGDQSRGFDAPQLPRRGREARASAITCATRGARCPRSCCRC